MVAEKTKFGKRRFFFSGNFLFSGSVGFLFGVVFVNTCVCAYVMDVCIGVCFIFDDTKKKKFFLSTSSAVSLFNNSGFPFGVSGILIVVY